MGAWYDWRLFGLRKDTIPIDFSKPGMPLYLLNRLKSAIWILLEKFLKKAFKHIREIVFSIFWFIIYYAFINLIMILIKMWRKSNHQFIQ